MPCILAVVHLLSFTAGLHKWIILKLYIQVHRGVYVAAEILYERFKPMVEEQLASSPFAKVAFTVSQLSLHLQSN